MSSKLVGMRRLMLLFVLLPLAVFSHLVLEAQPGGVNAGVNAGVLAPAEAGALVARALDTELRAAVDTGHPMRYRLRKKSPRLTSTKEIVESRDGEVARLVAINDQPLGPPDEQREQARLDALYGDPGLQRHRKQGEDQDTGIVLKLLHMLPTAFLYQYAGPATGRQGRAVERFTFKPNPHFSPPDFETEALKALNGELWIDAAQERVVRLEGHLQQDTDYGGGILGKLDKGGWVVIEQADAGGGAWRIVHVQMQMNLRVLFKTRNVDTLEDMSEYAPVPAGMDYRQAIQMLRAGAGLTAQASR